MSAFWLALTAFGLSIGAIPLTHAGRIQLRIAGLMLVVAALALGGAWGLMIKGAAQ